MEIQTMTAAEVLNPRRRLRALRRHAIERLDYLRKTDADPKAIVDARIKVKQMQNTNYTAFIQ